MAGDDISSETGDNADVSATGKGIRQNSQRSDPRQILNLDNSDRGGGNTQWIQSEILSHGAQIRELAYRLDDIPNQFQILKAEVKKLQDVEITVRPSEVVIRPVTPPESTTLSMRTLLIVLIVALGIVITLVALLYWQIAGA